MERRRWFRTSKISSAEELRNCFRTNKISSAKELRTGYS